MNKLKETSKPKQFDWREDLLASRDLGKREIDAFGYVLGWIESFRIKRDLPPGRAAAKQWWRETLIAKPRPAWQRQQWAEAIRWYLSWLAACQKSGGDGRSLPERLKAAVQQTGTRRGLAAATRKTYAGWLARFGQFAKDQRRVMDEGEARAFLSHLVDKEKVAFSTQKQALNALNFFYRDICGRRRRHRKTRHLSRAATFICDAFFKKRHGHPHAAGTSRPCGCEDDGDLHSRCCHRERERRAQPAGCGRSVMRASSIHLTKRPRHA